MPFMLSPRFLATFEQELGTRAALVAAGEAVAAHAQVLARRVDDDYETEVKVTARGVQVIGHAPGINPAAWIEFGTGGPTPTPAHAPMRRSAQALGLRLTPSRR